MNFVLFNLSISDSSLTEFEIDTILKEIPYGAKIGIKKERIDYSYILLPISTYEAFDEDFESYKNILENVINIKDVNINILYSIYKLLELVIKKSVSFSIDILNTELTQNDMDIFYTDGSFKKDEKKASFACCKLVNEQTDNQLKDDFTGENYYYLAFNGTINTATNNIGELTGIKVASENFGSHLYQLIISDSEYSIKTFREWYYVWKNNDFKNYAKKPIKNEDLIKETFNSLFTKDKLVLFKWTRGHDSNTFNEKCDELAKSALGIKK